MAGCCHTFSADGRCVTLLKVLLTNCCVYDCKYCVNRRSNDTRRAAFTPEELAELTIGFYRRNYIEGLFLSSGVLRSPDYTTELMIRALTILRTTYRFNGYIHAKTIPGTSPELVTAWAFWRTGCPSTSSCRRRPDSRPWRRTRPRPPFWRPWARSGSSGPPTGRSW